MASISNKIISVLRTFTGDRQPINLAIIHVSGLVLKFLFLVFLLKSNNVSALGFYSFVGALEAVVPYLLGFEIHTFTTRRYVKRPTPLRLANLIRTHYHILCVTILLSAVITVVVSIFSGNARDDFELLNCLAIIISAMVLQETTRVAVLLKRPEMATILTFVRGSAWQPFAILTISLGLPASPVIVFYWAIFTVAAMIWSIRIVGVMKKPKGTISLRYLCHGAKSSRDYYLVALAGSLQQNLDRLVLQSIIGQEVFGLYAFVQSLASSTSGLVQTSIINRSTFEILRSTSTPHKREDLIKKTALEAFSVAFIICITIALCFKPLVIFLGKHDAVTMSSTLAFLLVAQMASVVAQPYHLAIYAMHKDNILRNIMLAGIMITSLSVAAGGAYFGAVGAAAGIFLSFAMVSFAKIWIFYKL